MAKSFINYPGGKYKLLPQLREHFPNDYDRFVDLFAGSAVVSTNLALESSDIFAYDINHYLIELLRYVHETDYDEIMHNIMNIIGEFGLSDTFQHGYDYYEASSALGLADINKQSYLNLRDTFNAQLDAGFINHEALYALVVFGFNNQLRFNKSGRFNNPVGKRDFNAKMREKLHQFKQRVGELNIQFERSDFREIDVTIPNTFFYVDPPYLITTAVYNENGGWTSTDERDLLVYLDRIHESGNRFALSNVFSMKGRTNDILLDWVARNEDQYTVFHLNKSYSNSNYQTNENGSATDEVLVVNY
ncbi:Adenine-specific DNA methylase [Fructobacillus tropaeoli]|uniref:Dam family site-specific DNA-(adenine-N6)-methyltransferase n=1 Tax=Fructobacillus tropaeoli TaxID=709323 RepID=UPI002DA8EFDD|nr:Adenine-specific DNA methylase [Fructobacillus tropaeoli]